MSPTDALVATTKTAAGLMGTSTASLASDEPVDPPETLRLSWSPATHSISPSFSRPHRARFKDGEPSEAAAEPAPLPACARYGGRNGPRVENQLKQLPAKPGVYLFRDDGGDVLYVGKAKSLRPRVRSVLPEEPATAAPRS